MLLFADRNIVISKKIVSPLRIILFLGIHLNAPTWSFGHTGNFYHFAEKLGNQDAPINIIDITMNADIPFSQDELLYLTGLKVPCTISKRSIDMAYKRLMAKNRFNSITIDIDGQDSGKHLHFTLTGSWIFKRLLVSGILFGKQKYELLYNLQPGEIFDITLHEESISSIKKLLYDEGYFDGTVQAELLYVKKNKNIETRLTITQNHRYKIRNFTVAIAQAKEEKTLSASRMEKLKAKLEDAFGPGLIDTRYSKVKIATQVKKIRSFLQNIGFLNCHISMTRTINRVNRTLGITINAQLGKRQILKFRGNTILSADTIRNDLLGNDQPDWLFTPDIIKEQIMHEYYKRGYWHTSITHDDLESYGYLFSIKEGKPTLIENVEVINAATLMPETTKSFWADVLTNKTFDQALLEKSINNLQSSYLANGFWDFKIIEHRFVKNRATGNYTIRLLVEKGLQRFWGGLAIDGFKALEGNEFFLKYKVPTHQLTPFNIAWLQEQRVFLINHFQSEGYWYADVQPEIVHLPLEVSAKYPNATQLLVNWKVDLGEHVTFGKIIVRGNTKLPFNRIIKNLKFTEGDLWSKDKLDLTRKKLKRLDIFKSVHIFPYNMSKTTGKKPIILNLVDDDPVELRARAGYYLTSKNFMFERRSTPKLGGSIIIKNPTNCADKLMVDADWSLFDHKANLDYVKPNPFDLPIMSHIKGYTSKYVYPAQVNGSKSAYESLQHGVLVGISDEFMQDYHWGLNIGNEWLRTTGVRGNLKLAQNFIDRTLPFFFLEPSLVIDKLDDRLNTTKGTFGLYSIKTMFPEDSGDITTRLTMEQSFFYPIYEQQVIGAARLRFGHIFRRSFEHVMPAERFYLGGPYSVRCYDKDTVPPLGITETVQPDGSIEKSYTIQGGSSMMNANFELRFPLYKALGGVLFQDIGALSQSGFLGLGDRWYPSSGFGLRYKTPLGALRFDFGWKWQARHVNDSSYGWNLTLGEAF